MKVRSRAFVRLFVFLAVSSFVFAGDPTQAEQDLFKAIKDRIAGHKQQFPSPVSDILDSLNQEVTKKISCPKGTAVDSVEIKIKTKLVSWAPNPSDPGAQAQYKWNCHADIDKTAKKKTETCNNEISLDAAALRENENSKFNKVVNESILYHEFLHGQKLVDAFADSEWVKRLCNCEFPLYPSGVAVEKPAEDKTKSQQVHSNIRRLQDDYLVNVGQAEQFKIEVRQIERQADGDGSFSIDIDLGDLFPDGKEQIIGKLLPGDNVTGMNDERQGDKIHITGKLIDKTKAGNFRFVIDPSFNAALIRVEIAGVPASEADRHGKPKARGIN
jgi:hypothetical protein